MRLPRFDIGHHRRPESERLLAESRRRRPQPLSSKERGAEAVAAIALLVGVICLTVGFDATRTLELGPAVALTIAFALSARVRFDVGSGFTTPVQLVLWPMLFALPAPAVPLCIALG